MRKVITVILIGLLASITALAFGPVAHAAPSTSEHFVTHLSFGPAISPGCNVSEQKTNYKTPYEGGHLDVYLNYFICYDEDSGSSYQQYQLYVNSSNGAKMADNPYTDNLRVRVWQYGGFRGTFYGPSQDGSFSYASDWTPEFDFINTLHPSPQADDLGSYITNTIGINTNLPYLNF